MVRRYWFCLWLGLSGLLLGCGAEPIPPVVPTLALELALELPTAVFTPTLANTPPPSSPASPTSPASPSPTPLIADTGWQELQQGLHQRQLNHTVDNRLLESLYIVRLDPAHWRFDVAYTPGATQPWGTWQSQTNAAVMLNGGYYTPELYATGLIIHQGVAQGVSYDGFAGMLTVDGDGYPTVRWLANQPYDHASEQAWAGLQAFPMLVKPGGVLGYPAESESGRRARRTVIGQDAEGRVYFIVTPRGYFTLHELSDYLVQTDLGLEVAFNLDGGPSSGVWVQGGFDVSPFAPLPAVITAVAR
jgi:uncharacterized protein YigE (DUF2233 family)